MSMHFFSELFLRLRDNVRMSAPAELETNSDSLRHCLDDFFSRQAGDPQGLIGDPTFEATFGWKQADISMGELAGNLIDSRLAECLANPPEALRKD